MGRIFFFFFDNASSDVVLHVRHVYGDEGRGQVESVCFFCQCLYVYEQRQKKITYTCMMYLWGYPTSLSNSFC